LARLLGLALTGLLMLGIWLGSLVVFLIGVVFAWRGAVLTLSGIRVEGRVVGNYVYPHDSEATPYLVVVFTDLQGNTRRSILTLSSSNDPAVGRPIRLVYNPEDPSEVSGASFAQLWMMPLINCACGGVGVLFGIGLASGMLPTN
jgi:hypothetical protein